MVNKLKCNYGTCHISASEYEFTTYNRFMFGSRMYQETVYVFISISVQHNFRNIKNTNCHIHTHRQVFLAIQFLRFAIFFHIYILNTNTKDISMCFSVRTFFKIKSRDNNILHHNLFIFQSIWFSHQIFLIFLILFTLCSGKFSVFCFIASDCIHLLNFKQVNYIFSG